MSMLMDLSVWPLRRAVPGRPSPRDRPVVPIALLLMGAVVFVGPARLLGATPDPGAAEAPRDDAVQRGNAARQAGRIDEAIALYREASRKRRTFV